MKCRKRLRKIKLIGGLLFFLLLQLVSIKEYCSICHCAYFVVSQLKLELYKIIVICESTLFSPNISLTLLTCVLNLSVVSDSATSWTVAHQSLLSMRFSKQEYWRGLSGPSPGDLPNPRIEPASLESPALAGGLFTSEPLYVKKFSVLYTL